MSKLREAVVFTAWGATIFSFIAVLPRIDNMVAKLVIAILPIRVLEHLEAPWMGGDLTISLMGFVSGAVLGFATWLVYRSIAPIKPAENFLRRT
jgi:hypothetical protein